MRGGARISSCSISLLPTFHRRSHGGRPRLRLLPGPGGKALPMQVFPIPVWVLVGGSAVRHILEEFGFEAGDATGAPRWHVGPALDPNASFLDYWQLLRCPYASHGLDEVLLRGLLPSCWGTLARRLGILILIARSYRHSTVSAAAQAFPGLRAHCVLPPPKHCLPASSHLRCWRV